MHEVEVCGCSDSVRKACDDNVRNQVHGKVERAFRLNKDTAKNSVYIPHFLVQARTRLCPKSMNGFDRVKQKMDHGLFQKVVLVEKVLALVRISVS